MSDDRRWRRTIRRGVRPPMSQTPVRIRLLAMDDDPNPLPVGATGTIVGIGNGQVKVRWDPPHESRTLMLLSGKDRWEIISPPAPPPPGPVTRARTRTQAADTLRDE